MLRNGADVLPWVAFLRPLWKLAGEAAPFLYCVSHEGDVYAPQANANEECSAAPVAGGLPRNTFEDTGADHPIIRAGTKVTTCPSTVPVTLDMWPS